MASLLSAALLFLRLVLTDFKKDPIAVVHTITNSFYTNNYITLILSLYTLTWFCSIIDLVGIIKLQYNNKKGGEPLTPNHGFVDRK